MSGIDAPVDRRVATSEYALGHLAGIVDSLQKSVDQLTAAVRDMQKDSVTHAEFSELSKTVTALVKSDTQRSVWDKVMWAAVGASAGGGSILAYLNGIPNL